jgi:hypothetical protein
MRENLIVLAHAERSARMASGNTPLPVQGVSKVERFARALNEFWTGTTQAGKARVLESIEKLILDILGKRNSNEPLSSAIERCGMNRRVLRRQALTLVMSLSRTCDGTEASRDAWVADLRNMFRDMGIVPPQGQTLNRAISRPRGTDWALHLGAPQQGRLPFDTIHNAKGGEYEGVCVVIPPDDHRRFTTELFDAWASRSDHEPARVIYVGVTRAMRLLAVAVPESHLPQFVAILDAAGVPRECYGE